MKKILSIILACALLSMPTAYAETIYESDTQETITKGVTYRRLESFTEYGWTRANIIKVDLAEPNAEIKVLTAPSGSGRLATVKQMAQENGAKAAVNGDFFNFSSGETNMLGMVYQDGELVSTPAKDNLASFVLTDDNSVILDYFTFSGTLIAENTSLVDYSSCELYQVNKIPLTTGAVSMITSAWGSTLSVPAYCYAMITEPYEDGSYKMVGSSWGGESVTIPEDGAVFVANYSVNGFLNENFALGDVIKTQMSISPNIENIKEASGGNTLIVKNSKVATFTNNITGYNQRTALGVSKSGQTLILVTIDGRESDCVGMTQTQLAEFMIALGCDTAINFDGGGSTTMVTQDRFTSELNVQNSVSSLRKVSTSVGVFSTAEYTADVFGATVETSDDTIILGDSVEVYAAFYDDNYNNVPYSVDDVTYSCSDEYAVIDKNKITPTAAGTFTVSATFDGVTSEKEITVLNDIFAINIYPEVASTTSKDVSFTVTGYDRNGKSAIIPPSLVEFVPAGNIYFSGNTVKQGSGTGGVVAKYNLLTSIAVVNGDNSTRGTDEKELDSFEGALFATPSITITGKVSPSTAIDRLSANRFLFSLTDKGTVFALSDIVDKNTILKNYEKVTSYSSRTIENSKIITFSNSTSSSFRLTDNTSWAKFKDDCENMAEKNLVIMINNPLYQVNSGEQEVFNSFTQSLAQNGKNVFVVSTGVKSEVTVDKGVRYIYLGSPSDTTVPTYFYDNAVNKSVSFTFSGDEIMYSFN